MIMEIIDVIIKLLFAFAAILTAFGIAAAGISWFLWSVAATSDPMCEELELHPPLVWDDSSIWVRHKVRKHVDTLTQNKSDDKEE